jgi:cyanate permease
MPSLNHLVVHFRQYGFKHKTLYTVSLMLFFWSIYDGIISFISPILITERGFSNTLMGLIIGSSSMAGAVFDFILSKFLQNSYYRRLYLLMFGICFVYPLVLWQAKTIYLYLIAMALWGFYYDLQGFGNFDFVGREMETEEHASSFGVIGVFRSLGYLIAPLLVGLVIGQTLDWRPFALAWLFLLLSFFSIISAWERISFNCFILASTKP